MYIIYVCIIVYIIFHQIFGRCHSAAVHLAQSVHSSKYWWEWRATHLLLRSYYIYHVTSSYLLWHIETNIELVSNLINYWSCASNAKHIICNISLAPFFKVAFLRNVAWTLSNLCRNKSPPPPLESCQRCLPVFARMLCHDDKEILSDTCWALSYITDGTNDKIQVCKTLF